MDAPLLSRLVTATLPLVPTRVMRSIAGRYIAGETLEEAIAVLTALAARSHPGALDILGEDVADPEAAREAASQYCSGARAVAAAGLDTYISIKPTHLGMRLDPKLALDLYSEVCVLCSELGLSVRVEMEDHTNTDATLELFSALTASHTNVGVVLQSRLFRTPGDIARLPRGANVRIVKGIYLEPASIAHTEAGPIRDAFVECTRLLAERDAFCALATHDEEAAERCVTVLREVGSGGYEFQVLLGVREPLWEEWRRAGHVVRVYVPFGPEWRAYSTRRLRKNPQIVSHVMRDMFRFS